MPPWHRDKLMVLIVKFEITKLEDFSRFRSADFMRQKGFGPKFLLVLKKALIKNGCPFDLDTAEDIDSKIRAMMNPQSQNLLSLRFEIFKRDEFKCRYCGRGPSIDNTVILQIDHVRPKAKGGDWSKQNLLTACQECNLGKSDVLLKEHKKS